MSFVNQLNQMANGSSIENKLFKNRVTNLKCVIHNTCRKHVNEREAQGYIFRSYDSEYNVESFIYNENIYKEYKREVVQPKYGPRLEGKYTACHASHSPISNNKEYVERLINTLKPMLVEDGFKTIRLEVYTYKNCFDIIKRKSRLLTCDYWRERQYTEEVLGYIVKFYVSW